MSVPSPHLSTFTLDALALDALDAGGEAQARDHLAGCARCREALEAARAAREHFQRTVLPRTVSAVRERARRSSWRLGWHHPLVPRLLIPAFAAAVALLLVTRTRHVPGPQDADLGAELGIKGAATLQVFASRDDHVFPVQDGSSLAPGDRVRFVVMPAGLPYLLIASIDGAGAATVYHPPGGSESGRLDDRARLELPGSIVLDAAPGPERIYALFSRQAIAADQVASMLRDIGARGPDAIRSARTLDIPDAVQASVLFEKVTP